MLYDLAQLHDLVTGCPVVVVDNEVCMMLAHPSSPERVTFHASLIYEFSSADSSWVLEHATCRGEVELSSLHPLSTTLFLLQSSLAGVLVRNQSECDLMYDYVHFLEG